MSMLISSATAGTKAPPPKPPPRRRAGGPPSKPAPKPTQQQPAPTDESSTSQTPSQDAPVPAAARPTPPPTQSSTVRQTIEQQPQHVRFAEPVTVQEPERNAQNAPTPTPASRNVNIPSDRELPSSAPASQAQTSPRHQTSALDQILLTEVTNAPGEHLADATVSPGSSGPTPSQDVRSTTGQTSGSIDSTGVEHAPDVTPNQANASPSSEVSHAAESAKPQKTTRPAKRGRPTDANTQEPRARKAPKRNSTRSNATVQAQIEGDSVPGPSQTPRRPPVARMMATTEDPSDDANVPDVANAEGHPEESAAATKQASAKRKPRKAKTPARVDEEESHEGEGGQHAPKPKKLRRPRQKAAPKSRAKKATPVSGGEGGTDPQADGEIANEEEESDPELHEIDPEALSMYTMTKQKRYGKTSEREKKMAEIDWDEVKRKRRAEAAGEPMEEPQQSGAVQKEQDAGASNEDADGEAAPEKQEAATRAVQGGLGFRVVNGEIVEDEETLQIDRRAQAEAEIAMQAPVEEENDLTRFHNRATYLNDRKRDEKDRVPAWKSKSDPWNEDETDRFYDALKNWGTDFMIISQLFPPKTRAQIKKKFNREERIDPERVNAALLGKDPVRMDLNAYAQAANLDIAEFNKFDSLEHAQSLISESMKDKEEAMRAAVKEAEETERQRAVHEAGKKKSREGAEERKRLTQAKKAMRNKGMVWGTGTFGGGGGEEEAGGEA